MSTTYEELTAERTKLFNTYWLLVLEERKRQFEKWGDQAHKTDGVWTQILMEEIGEWNRAVLEEMIEHAKTEMVQVIAVTYAWLQGRLTPAEMAEFDRNLLFLFCIIAIRAEEKICIHTKKKINIHEWTSMRLLDRAGQWVQCLQAEKVSFAVNAFRNLIIDGLRWLHSVTDTTSK